MAGTPDKASEPQDMRQRILDAATALFAARGFHGTSLSAIAEAVGVRKPSLLYHFPSKEALREAALESMLAHWRADIAGVLARSRVRDQLTTVLRAMVDYFRASPERARLLMRESLDNPEGMQELLRRHLAPWTGLLVDHLRFGQEQGTVWEELDPASYILHMILSGVGLVAFADMGAAILPDAPRSIDDSLAELMRIARVALFRPRPPTPATEE